MCHGPDPRAAQIRLEGAGKRYFLSDVGSRETVLAAARRVATGQDRQTPLWALRDVSLMLRHGEILGVIGPNGAGKSTLLMLLSGIMKPTEGRVEVAGTTSQFFHLSSGLQPRITVLENFSLCAALLGMSRRVFEERFPAILEFSGLDHYLHARYGELSTGLAARLPFSTAIHADCDILLVDEMLAVGDAAFQEKCAQAFMDLRGRGKTMVIVSHNMEMIGKLCTRALYLKEGRMRALGEVRETVGKYLSDSGPTASSPLPPARIPAEQVAALRTRLEAELRAEMAAAAREDRPKGPPRADHDALADRMATRLDVEPASIYLLNYHGLRLVLRWMLSSDALGKTFQPGDEVIVPAALPEVLFESLVSERLVPVLVDLTPQGLKMDLPALERALSARSRAVVLRHNFGNPCDMDFALRLCREHGLILIDLIMGLANPRWRGKPLATWGDLAIHLASQGVPAFEDTTVLVARRPLRESPLVNRAYCCPASLSTRRTAAALELLASLDASMDRRLDDFSRVHEAACAYPDAFFPAELLPEAGVDPEVYPLVLRPGARIDLRELLSSLRREGVAAYPVLWDDPLRSRPHPPPHRWAGNRRPQALQAAALHLACETSDPGAVLRRLMAG